MLTFLRLLARLPFPVLYFFSNLCYFIAYYLLRYRKEIVYKNMRNAFPEKSEQEIQKMAKGFYKNLCDVIVEAVKAQCISPEALQARVRFTNLEAIKPYLNDGKPLVLLAAHQCNWEWLLMASSAQLDTRLDALYKPLHNKAADLFMLTNRTRFGAHLWSVKNAIFELLKNKRKLSIITAVADQPPLKKYEKYWTQCLNQETAFHVGMEKLARLLQCPVFFVGMQRVKRGHYTVSLTQLALPPYEKDGYAITQKYSEAFEAQIKAAPSDWLWSNRRWKYKKPLYGSS